MFAKCGRANRLNGTACPFPSIPRSSWRSVCRKTDSVGARVKGADGSWSVWSVTSPGRDFTQDGVGFLYTSGDEVAVSNSNSRGTKKYHGRRAFIDQVSISPLNCSYCRAAEGTNCGGCGGKSRSIADRRTNAIARNSRRRLAIWSLDGRQVSCKRCRRPFDVSASRLRRFYRSEPFYRAQRAPNACALLTGYFDVIEEPPAIRISSGRSETPVIRWRVDVSPLVSSKQIPVRCPDFGRLICDVDLRARGAGVEILHVDAVTAGVPLNVNDAVQFRVAVSQTAALPPRRLPTA